MRYPPGVSQSDFDRAVRQFESSIGAEWVFTDEADVDLYRDAYSPLWGEEEEKIPSIALAPQSAEEVQSLMAICNEFQIPVYPVSTGKNLGYGGSAPVLTGSVVLDLKRMNRIIEVNEENAFALVEPGVSYFDLYNYIQEKGLDLWIDCPDPGWGSLIGNSLDHGVGYTVNPYRDHFEAHCGMEVVLADGDIVRTGMGALPNAETWQQYRWGYGPWMDGLFAQSNFGVVTKMGFWLSPAPEAFCSGSVQVMRYNDVHELVRITAKMMYSGILNSNAGVQSPMQFAIGQNPEMQERYERANEEDIRILDEFARSNNTPFWSSQFKFYGPREIVDSSWEYVKRQFADIDGVRYQDQESLNFPMSYEELMQTADENHLGVPSMSVFQLGNRSNFNPAGTNGHLGFSPVVPMTGEAVLESNKVLGRVLREMGGNTVFNVPPYSYHQRTFTILVGFTVTRDADTNRKTREIFRELVKVAAEHGWGEYRTHTAFMDDCAAAYSFNDNALLRLQQTLKDAIDPRGIISAGRYGIWPKHIRDTEGKGVATIKVSKEKEGDSNV
ncbi:MAG: FAD-binding oxidoreductase [Gammaproteobacteria bacterium]|jgi:4-cresol dehydrogenase (hydroxylating)|nr:FAD-binding oxidoreductase [Gammaproteobacteria bacterium]